MGFFYLKCFLCLGIGGFDDLDSQLAKAEISSTPRAFYDKKHPAITKFQRDNLM
jgi:hypothetical protein